MRQSQEEQCIFAGANEPEENESKWSCTLFKPNYVDVDARRVQFFHVQVGRYSQVKILEPYFYLYVGSNDSVDYVYKIIDWESLLIMPKHVAFKGDNGQCLSARWIDGHQYLQFASNDVGDPTVVNEIFTTHDGSIRVKSDYFGKFWRVDNNVVALRNLGNDYFCKRLTSRGMTNCLNAGVSTISKEAQIEVENVVISKQIYNVNFYLLDARIYSKRVLTMATGVVINRTQEPNNVEVKLSYTKTKSSTWNASVSLKMGVKTNFKANVPFIANGDGPVKRGSIGNSSRKW
ncbi:hypothetical protein K1719_045865 [Acacia pycnantha]|nr:hypothetical protein K1719_045865 [Acacia pycnantha]